MENKRKFIPAPVSKGGRSCRACTKYYDHYSYAIAARILNIKPSKNYEPKAHLELCRKTKIIKRGLDPFTENSKARSARKSRFRIVEKVSSYLFCLMIEKALLGIITVFSTLSGSAPPLYALIISPIISCMKEISLLL